MLAAPTKLAKKGFGHCSYPILHLGEEIWENATVRFRDAKGIDLLNSQQHHFPGFREDTAFFGSPFWVVCLWKVGLTPLCTAGFQLVASPGALDIRRAAEGMDFCRAR